MGVWCYMNAIVFGFTYNNMLVAILVEAIAQFPEHRHEKGTDTEDKKNKASDRDDKDNAAVYSHDEHECTPNSNTTTATSHGQLAAPSGEAAEGPAHTPPTNSPEGPAHRSQPADSTEYVRTNA